MPLHRLARSSVLQSQLIYHAYIELEKRSASDSMPQTNGNGSCKRAPRRGHFVQNPTDI